MRQTQRKKNIYYYRCSTLMNTNDIWISCVMYLNEEWTRLKLSIWIASKMNEKTEEKKTHKHLCGTPTLFYYIFIFFDLLSCERTKIGWLARKKRKKNENKILTRTLKTHSECIRVHDWKKKKTQNNTINSTNTHIAIKTFEETHTQPERRD